MVTVVRRKRSRGGICKTLQLASLRIKKARPRWLPPRFEIAKKNDASYNDAKIVFCFNDPILLISRGIIQRLRYATVK